MHQATTKFEKHTHPDMLERYSFLYSEVRLVIAAAALLMGGVPVLRILVPFQALSGLVGTILTITWLLSGIASGYLLYRWLTNDKVLFGEKETRDTAAFLVSVVSGINLGIVGLAEINIGMSITVSYPVFALTALVYLASALHLYQRWQKSQEKLFHTPSPETHHLLP